MSVTERRPVCRIVLTGRQEQKPGQPKVSERLNRHNQKPVGIEISRNGGSGIILAGNKNRHKDAGRPSSPSEEIKE